MEGELLGQMVEAVGVGVGAYDETGAYVYVNQAYADMLDTDRDSLIGTRIWEVNDAVDPDRFEEYWNSYDDGETRTAEAVHEFGSTALDVQTITTRIETPDGRFNVGTIQDISIQKRRERQLSRLHAVTDELIEAGSVDEIARVITETAEQILDFNRTVVRVATDTGELEPVLVTDGARTDFGDCWAYDADEETAAVRAFEEGETVVVEDVTTLDDGYDRGDTAAVLYVPIGSYGLISITHHEPGAFDETDLDLASIPASNAETAFRRLENERDLRRQNERLEAFVDVITHDIPNHLTVATTRVDLARQTGDLSHLDQVANAHDRIESVISDMHTLVNYGDRIESATWVRLSDIVTGCWENCREEESNGTLEFDGAGYIRADESRLKQLLENLFWNALSHAGPDPTVRVGLLPDGFFVEDDGPGIPESQREKVLSPGFSEADDGDHSGFGLAIVQEITRAHDWEVSITDSELGDGTPGARFEFTGVTVNRENTADGA
ncbi:PAS domain-containing protein [Halovenus sp. WSH3]|uniref:histidine kinase n=1 Tax=Halovenus carboxidivorans TaxID=2692199 RepID=A0A6B0T7Q8_9EURY|nr:ATP-binding protein [Halovenus carboxidivorans]MXR51231.1 PAS domain-containing protein [Halovenus carboxidivorans]